MSAQRGHFHLAGHLRTGARTLHFFEIGDKCENPLISKARGVMPSEQRERRNGPLSEA